MSRELMDIVITGIGARAALGEHAVQVAASVRAGISGFRAWGRLSGPDGELSAAPCEPRVPEGPWAEKTWRLLRGPAAEALHGAGWHDDGVLTKALETGRMRAYVGLPYADRAGVDPAHFAQATQALTFDLPPVPASVQVLGFGADQVAGLVALARAAEALQTGQVDAALVCGFDSLLDSAALEPLHLQRRIKTRGTTSGLIPGEAGVCLVVETAAAARRRKVTVLARVEAIALEQDAGAHGPEAPVTAHALGRVLEATTAGAGGAQAFTRVIADLNGERWRFLEWSLAETRFSGGLPPGWRLWHPADLLGDVGAAFGPLAAVLAVRAFARGYAGPGKVLVVASSDRGERGALALAPPEGGAA
jgi:3-oxoacyl-[acyl-carrier-protein] synthase-1